MKDDKTGDGLPPLPESLDYCYEWDGPYGSRKFSAALHNGRPPDRSVAIYTADQIRARDAMWAERLAAAAARERELCAQACDARDMGDGSREDQEARRCAAAIRGMI